MSRRGFTLIELLIAIFVLSMTVVTAKSFSAYHGQPAGIVAGLLAGLICFIAVYLFYSWLGRWESQRLKDLRERYLSIYRVVATGEPKIIALPEGAEIQIGDYGWEAGPNRSDGLIYLHGLTTDWRVVWHAGLRSDQLERIATKPNSQYDSWHPFWADPPPLPPCPYPIVERETMTIGRPHHTHRCADQPTPYSAPD